MTPAKSDLKHILKELVQEPCEFHAISGGDTGSAFAMVTNKRKSFLKVYTGDLHNEMVKAEVLGLNALRESQVNVPQLINKELRDDFSLLALEWIEESTNLDPKKMAYELVKMHKTRGSHFGFSETTFVGSVLQINHKDEDWSNFWWEQRIKPLWSELKAQGGSYLNECMSAIEENKANLFPEEPPSLIHGDLWGGNILPSSNHECYLIDPGVYYGHREMDLAMLMLFSDFREVIQEYNKQFPLKQDWQNRVYLCQLYPLLVHWKLFGLGYKEQIESAFRKAGYK